MSCRLPPVTVELNSAIAGGTFLVGHVGIYFYFIWGRNIQRREGKGGAIFVFHDGDIFAWAEVADAGTCEGAIPGHFIRSACATCRSDADGAIACTEAADIFNSGLAE